MANRINIALFGFGRIGRNLFRLGYDNPKYNFVAISDFGSSEALHYLLARDSIHGSMEDEVRLDGNHLIVKNQRPRLINGGEARQCSLGCIRCGYCCRCYWEIFEKEKS